jgi:hypothetical protein
VQGTCASGQRGAGLHRPDPNGPGRLGAPEPVEQPEIVKNVPAVAVAARRPSTVDDNSLVRPAGAWSPSFEKVIFIQKPGLFGATC